MIHYVHTKFHPILGCHLQTFVELILNDPIVFGRFMQVQSLSRAQNFSLFIYVNGTCIYACRC